MIRRGNEKKIGKSFLTAVCASLFLGSFGIAVSAEELKIGVIATATGPGTQWGRAVLHGAEMAVEDVNHKVTVRGKSYDIKLIHYDDEFTGKGGLSAATRLIFEDKVKFIIGPLGTSSWMAAKDIVEKNKVIATPATFARKALENTQFAFRVGMTPDEFAPIMCKWLKEKYPNLKKVAIHAPNDQTGWETQAEDIMGYEMNGFEIVFKEFHEQGTKDFFPLLTRMMAQKPDILELNGTSPGNCGLMVKQARQMGFKGLVVKVGGPVTEELVRIAGKDNVEGSIVYTPFDPKDSKIEPFVKRYEAKYKAQMNNHLPLFYDMSKLLFYAIEKAGTADDTTKVAKEMESVDFNQWKGGLGVTIGFTGKEKYGINHQAVQAVAVAKIADGREVVLATLDWK